MVVYVPILKTAVRFFGVEWYQPKDLIGPRKHSHAPRPKGLLECDIPMNYDWDKHAGYRVRIDVISPLPPKENTKCFRRRAVYRSDMFREEDLLECAAHADLCRYHLMQQGLLNCFTYSGESKRGRGLSSRARSLWNFPDRFDDLEYAAIPIPKHLDNWIYWKTRQWNEALH